MTRLIIAGAVMILTAIAICRGEESNGNTVVRLTVHPAPAPSPPLRYELLPDVMELSPGNPIQGYLKMFVDNHDMFHSNNMPFFYFPERADDEWFKIPLQQLPLDKLKDLDTTPWKMIDTAARLELPNWQCRFWEWKKYGWGEWKGPLPEVVLMPDVVGRLQMRIRIQLADGRLNDAIATAKTLFAICRHLGECPTPFGSHYGTITGLRIMESLEEVIQKPECPNLYWALSSLPIPLVDTHQAIQGDWVLRPSWMDHVNEKAQMADAALQSVVSEIPGQDDADKLRARLSAKAADAAYLEAARSRLHGSGLNAAVVRQLPALQVVLLNEIAIRKIARDELVRSMSLPYWQASATFAADLAHANKIADSGVFSADMQTMIKDLHSFWVQQNRLDQRVALLRCVEAIRLYAAEHNGEFPKQLGDMTVPLPIDPITGKPPIYELNESSAAVRGSSPLGVRDEQYKFSYEISLAK